MIPFRKALLKSNSELCVDRIEAEKEHILFQTEKNGAPGNYNVYTREGNGESN